MDIKKSKDLMAKLCNVYSKDIYFHKRFAINGIKTYENTYGNSVSILEEKWYEILKDILDEINIDTNDIIYIKDTREFKTSLGNDDDIWKSMITVVNDINEIEKVNSIIKDFTNIPTDDNWKSFSELENFEATVIDNKGIFDIPIENTDYIIRIGKPVLPLLTSKTIRNYTYYIEYDEKSDIYKVYIHFIFTHFQTYIFCHALIFNA